MANDLGVWTAQDCALVLIDYQNEMFGSSGRRRPGDKGGGSERHEIRARGRTWRLAAGDVH